MIDVVSAIITTHNRFSLLKRAVKSVRQQTYPQMELIVVDDASDDNETEIWCLEQERLQEKPEQPFRYIHISKAESKGGNHARNLGIIAAHGEYIAFLDDDDAWFPEKTQKQLDLLKEKNCEFVYGGRRLEIIRKQNIAYWNERAYLEGDLSKKILLTICCTTTSAILTKRQALIEIGLFDEALNFWQEYELTIRMAQRSYFYYVKEPVTLYRIDQLDQARLTNKLDGWKESVKYIYKKHAALFARLSFWEKVLVRHLYCQDAADRAQSSGKKLLAKCYRVLDILLRNLYRIAMVLKKNGFPGLLFLLKRKFKLEKLDS